MIFRYLLVLISMVPAVCLADKWVSGPPTVVCDTQEQVYKMVSALAELPPEESAPIVYGSGCQVLGNALVSSDMIVVSVIPFGSDTYMLEVVGVDGNTYYVSTKRRLSTTFAKP